MPSGKGEGGALWVLVHYNTAIEVMCPREIQIDTGEGWQLALALAMAMAMATAE